MFRITADEITYDGRRIALLRPDLAPTFLDDVVELLESATSGAISEEKHNDALQEMSREHDIFVETLETRIAFLEKENRLLEKDNEELERLLNDVREEAILAEMRADD